MQIRIYSFLAFLLIVFNTSLYAASCEAVGNEVDDDDDGDKVAFLSENFPNADCSFEGLNINPQSLRFSGLTFGGAGGTFFANPFFRLGPRLYRLDDNVQIYDTSKEGCVFDESSFFVANDTVFDENTFNNIAFILDGDSLKAPRVITHIWLLNCDIDTTR